LSSKFSPTKIAYEVGSSESPVIHIEYLGAGISSESASENHDLLLVQQQGQITVLSGNLDKERCRMTLHSGLGTTHEPNVDKERFVESVIMMDAPSAIDGFLAERQEVLAMLSSMSESGINEPRAINLFCLVSRPVAHESLVKEGRTVHMISIHQRSSWTSHSLALYSVTSWNLPSAETTRNQKDGRSQYSFSSTSGILQELIGGILNVYDLTSAIPKVMSRFSNPQDPIASFLPVSTSISMLSSKNQGTLYDIRFQSTQSIQSAGNLELTDGRNGKRKKLSGEESREPVQLLDHFKDVSLAVGLSGNALWAFQITQDTTAIPRKKRKTTKLAESLGRGHGAALSSSLPSDQDSGWQKRIGSLDQLVAAQNVEGFEILFFKTLRNHMRLNGEEDRFRTIAKYMEDFACVVNGTHMDASVMLGNVSEGVKTKSSSRGPNLQTLYALTKTFSWAHDAVLTSTPRSEAMSSIKITFMPAKVFAWLVLEGFMTPEAITESLRGSTVKSCRHKVTATDMIDAIAQFDPSLIHLSYLLLQSTSLDFSGTMHALGSIIRSFNQPEPILKNRLLTNGTNDLTNNILEHKIQNEEASPPHHQPIAPPLSDCSICLRGAALKKCLLQFARLSHPTERVNAMRSHLPPLETISLIELLRIALAQGGWTSRYLDFHPAEASSYSADQTPDSNTNNGEAITDICGLLNCALDALGTGAWLASDLTLSPPSNNLNSSEHNNTGTIVSQLRDEISAALEGVQCCSFFNGFLKDFLRFEQAAAKSAAQRGGGGGSRGGGHNAVFGSSDAVVEYQTTESMLPLGLKTVQRVEGTRIGAGGEIQTRSARETGMKLSKRLGKYTFEKIRV